MIKMNTYHMCNSVQQKEKAVYVSAAIKHLAGKEWSKWHHTGKSVAVERYSKWNTLLSFNKCAVFIKGFYKFP